MTDNKTSFATPNSSKLAQILLQLKEIDGVGESEVSGENTLHFSNAETESDEVTPNTTQDASQSLAVETCNCRKSKCLKLYCQCFAGKMTCNPLCRCVSCENTPDNSVVRTEAIKIILERNPNAFDSKFKPVSATGTSVPVLAVAPISVASHKNGCRCRKSFCLKKYCECFQASVTCSAICTCLSCCNTGSSSSSLQLADSIVVVNGQHPPLSSHRSSLNISSAVRIGGVQQVVVKKKGDQLLDSSEQVLLSPPPALASSRTSSSSLDGFLTHMIDSFGPSSAHMGLVKTEAGASSAFNSTRPPLVPSSAKRKREEGDERAGSSTGTGNPSTPNHNASLLSEEEKHQATNLLERQLFTDFGSGVLTGMFPSSDHGGGGRGGGASVAPIQNVSMRSASPNSMSIATALSLFAANCFHHYNSSLSVPVASPPSSVGSSCLLPGSSQNGGVVVQSDVLQLTPMNSAYSGEEGRRNSIAMGLAGSSCIIDALDTSTTSEDTDEEPHEQNRRGGGGGRGLAATGEELVSSQQSVISSSSSSSGSSHPDEE